MNVTIDGRAIDVPAGTTILRAAKQLGIDIPVFCYHPGLTIPANCRMCLVEIEKVPKPMPACYTEVAEGMVVRTQSEKVAATQKAVLEFILLNHPVDCPVCDQAGECVLQEHYATYSAQPSRLMHQKVGKPKAKILGPTVVLDAERCIICTRCVRFCDEVSRTHELTVEDRGEHSEICTPEGVELDNPYSLNVVDICPVGALTSREFRFRRRVWFLDMRDSVCTGCARGCNVRVDSHANKVERLVPRYNPDVNQWWMCDDGRKSLESRTISPMTMGFVPGPADAPREAPALDGLRVLAGWLQVARSASASGGSASASGGSASASGGSASASGGSAGVASGTPIGRVGFGLSASLTNEDVYAWARLAQALDARVYLLKRAPWQGDSVLRVADRDANDRGARAILSALVPDFGDLAALEAEAPLLGTLIVVDNEIAASEGLLQALATVSRTAVLTDLASPVSQAAQVVVPLAPLHARDGTLVNAQGWVQRLAAPLKPAVTVVAPHVAAAALGHGAEGLDFTEKTRPAELFNRLALAVPAFRGLDYGEIGDQGRGLPVDGEVAARRARVNGTPQWEPDPVAPTYQRPFAIRRGA